jgi:hypothetical protein
VRFLVAPSPDLAERARPPVRWFLAFTALLLLGMGAQRATAGGLSPAGVEARYLGPDGTEPMPAMALWEELHQNAFVYGFLLLMLGSLVAISPLPARGRRALVLAASAAALADSAAPFAIVAAGGLGSLRVVTFAAALAALLVSVAVGWSALRPPRRGDA